MVKVMSRWRIVFSKKRINCNRNCPILNPDSLVFSSPLTRCVQLAERLSDNVTTDARLLELDFGDWEGKRFDDIDVDVLQQWTDNFVHSRRLTRVGVLVEVSVKVTVSGEVPETGAAVKFETGGFSGRTVM